MKSNLPNTVKSLETLASQYGKRNLLEEETPKRSMLSQLAEAVFCLAFACAGIYVMMVVGVRAGL